MQSVDRFVVEYREAGKCISVHVESDYTPGIKPSEKIASTAFSRWDDGTPVPFEKQSEILKNFTDAMEFQGISVVVE